MTCSPGGIDSGPVYRRTPSLRGFLPVLILMTLTVLGSCAGTSTILLSSNDASISRTSSLLGTGCGTEMVIGNAFAERLLSLIKTLPVSCSYCISIVSTLALIAWNELRASGPPEGDVGDAPTTCCAVVTEICIITPSNKNEKGRKSMRLCLLCLGLARDIGGGRRGDTDRLLDRRRRRKPLATHFLGSWWGTG